MASCILRAYFSCVLSDTQIPNSDSSLGVKVLTRHVNVICIFIFILILAVVFPLLSIKNFRAEMMISRYSNPNINKHLQFGPVFQRPAHPEAFVP